MTANKSEVEPTTKVKEKCGIVMPISPIDGCTADHWSDVLNILREAITDAGFEHNLVSDADDIGIIQKRIIQNLYNNKLIICDVSCKNPNVMFELGIRLAFDKPTIIIKDDLTDYTFDTSIIEHITYPRDLRFQKIVSFKENLKKKILATNEAVNKDPKYSTFLKSFGEFTVANLSEKAVTTEEFLLTSFNELRKEVINLRNEKGFINTRRPKYVQINDHMVKKEGFIDSKADSFVKVAKLKDKSAIRNNEDVKKSFINWLYKFEETHIMYPTFDELLLAIDDEIIPF